MLPRFFVFVLLAGCSLFNFQPSSYRLIDIEFFQKIVLDFTPEKCVFSSRKNTAFIADFDSGKIYIFKDGKQTNIIGGPGFENQNFNKLTDITLSVDESLLALDSFQKKIKVFDEDGRWITDYELAFMIEPVSFDVSRNETFYIFDRSRKEILIVRNFLKDYRFTFGKFLLQEPDYLILNDNKLTVYDRSDRQTKIFDTLGNFDREMTGRIQIERNNTFILEDYYLDHPESKKKFAVSTRKWNNFLIKNNFLILLSNDRVWIGKILYERI